MFRVLEAPPYNRVVSLWDMISYLDGTSFAAIANISQIADKLYDADTDEKGRVWIKDVLFVGLHKSVVEVQRIAVELELDATISAAKDCLEFICRHDKKPSAYLMSKTDAERLCWALSGLSSNFSAQMHSRVAIVFNNRNAQYLTSADPVFGREVDDAFPKSAEEISEAAKCLALQRNTACVFHLMRAMESAVARLAEAIGTGKPTDKEWGKILADIGATIEAMPRGAKRDEWSQSHSHLYHVKQAWRNDTMHPKKTYTDEQAQAVFDAVRSFMVHLAPLVS